MEFGWSENQTAYRQRVKDVLAENLPDDWIDRVRAALGECSNGSNALREPGPVVQQPLHFHEGRVINFHRLEAQRAESCDRLREEMRILLITEELALRGAWYREPAYIFRFDSEFGPSRECVLPIVCPRYAQYVGCIGTVMSK